jgi:hypothetical protein
MRALTLMLVIASAVAAADPAPSTKLDMTDAEFRAAVTAFANTTHRRVVAWGTAPLAGTKAPQRFATLAALGGKAATDTDPIVCGNDACRGAYVIEEAPGKIWLVSYTDQRWGFTQAFHGPDSWPPAEATPRWEADRDIAIEHHQNHNLGTQVVRFALRDDDVVVLEMHDEIRAGDVDEVNAPDGKCKHRCPSLVERARRDTLGWYMQPVVVGPVARVADLREPAAPPDQGP